MRGKHDRGFTLVEVLVALAAASMTLAAIAELAHGAARSEARAAVRLAQRALAQALLADPGERRIDAEPSSGESDGGLRWTLTTTPTTDDANTPPATDGWTPAIVRVDLGDRIGGRWSVETVRLMKAPAK
jgi:prepilin-type N-terminal cleavage/methylation domain-containing protein